MPDGVRRYVVVVQDARGYPAIGAPREPAPPDGPEPPWIRTAVLVEDFDRVVVEREQLREQIDWTIERCNATMGEGFAGTANSAVAAVCDLVELLRADVQRHRNLLERIGAGLADGTLEVPDVALAVEEEIGELLGVRSGPSASGDEA